MTFSRGLPTVAIDTADSIDRGSVNRDLRPAEEVDSDSRLVSRLQASMRLSRFPPGTRRAISQANEAWNDFYARYHPGIRRTVQASRVRECDRDDCIQEVWVAILGKLGTFDSHRVPCRFRSWLATLVQNRIRVFLRRPALTRSGGIAPLDSYPDQAACSPAAICLRRTSQQAVREVFAELRARLPSMSFSVMELRYLREESVSDTATALGITCEQVHYRQYRAMRKLRQLLRARGLHRLTEA